MLENVGANLRRWRRARELSQKQVAQFAGIHQPQVSAIERGLQPTPDLLVRLARAVGAHPNDLLRSVPKNEPVAAAQGGDTQSAAVANG